MRSLNVSKQKSRDARTTKQRDLILRAAEKEFALKGFTGARVDKIARAAGIEKASLYYHFRSKEDLYQAVLSEVTQAFTLLSRKGYDQDIDPGEELAEFVGLLVDFLDKHRSFALILRRELSEPGRPRRGEVYKAFSPLIQQVRDFVYKDISKGEMRRVDPENTLYSMFELLFSYFTMNPEAAEIFFGKAPYAKDMIQRRKAHLTAVIRRFLAPDG